MTEPREAPGPIRAAPVSDEATGVLAVEQSLRVQSAFVTLSRTLRTLFAIAVPIVMVRVLDPSTFGYYKQIGLLCTTAAGALALGIPTSLYYFVPRSPDSSQRLLVRSFVLLGSIGLCAGIGVALAAPWLDRAFSAPFSEYRIVVAALVALSIPDAMSEAVAVVDRRVRLAALATGLVEALRSLLVVSAALWTRNLTVVLVAVTAGLGLRILVLLAYLAWRRTHTSSTVAPARSSEQLGYAFPFHAAAMIGMARDQLHAYFVATRYAASQYAVYAVGITPLPLLDRITQSVAEVVVVDSSRNFAIGRLDEVRRVWWRGSHAIALAVIPAFAICEVFATDILGLLYGDTYRASAPVMRIYLFVLLFSIPLSSVLLRASASPRAMIVADLASLVGSISSLALFVLATPLGPEGAVASMVIGLAVFHGVAGATVARRVGVTWRTFLPWRNLAGLALLCGSGAGIAGLLTLPLPGWLRALAGPLLAAALIGAMLWRSILLPEPERALVRRGIERAIERVRRRGTEKRP